MASRLRKSPDRQFSQTVVFIHHFGGNYMTSHRHQAMVLKMGFDCFSFDLCEQNIPSWTGWFPDSLGRFGHAVVQHWARELETVLDSIEGEKIIFSFSYPSTSVPALLAARPRSDIKAWICDGGPFLEMFRCQLKLFKYGLHIQGAYKRVILSLISYFIMGGPLYLLRVGRWLRAMDTRLPILSLRAGRDRLVPPRATDKFFAKNPQLNIQRGLWPEADHLEGLKTYPEDYRNLVEKFLATALRT